MLAPQIFKSVIGHDALAWFIARSEPRRESLAKASLDRVGFEVYYPKCKVMKFLPRDRLSHSRRAKMHLQCRYVEEPMLKNYLFIRPHNGASFGLRGIFDLTGVSGIVHFGEQLARISDDAVDKIREGEAKGVFDQIVAKTTFPYKVGQRVRLMDGIFTGSTGFIDRLDESRETIHVLISFLGQKCGVLTSVEALEAL